MAEKDPGYSPFVQAVAGDGSSAPEVRMLTGWLGPSGEEGHVRLYLDASLSTYVDIPRDAILYSEEIPNSHPSGARTVWVKSGANVKEGGSALARAAKFLSGAVQKDYLTDICLTYKPGCEHARVGAAQCVGQTFQTGASCPCPPQTGVQCQPDTAQCPPVSPHPQCCYGQTFQTGIQGCQPHALAGAAHCVGQTFQTGASCPCPPQTGVQCIPATVQCPPVSPHPQCCYGQTFQTGIQGCQPAALAATGPGWTCVCPPPPHTAHTVPCTGGPCTGFLR